MWIFNSQGDALTPGERERVQSLPQTMRSIRVTGGILASTDDGELWLDGRLVGYWGDAAPPQAPQLSEDMHSGAVSAVATAAVATEEMMEVITDIRDYLARLVHAIESHLSTSPSQS